MVLYLYYTLYTLLNKWAHFLPLFLIKLKTPQIKKDMIYLIPNKRNILKFKKRL